MEGCAVVGSTLNVDCSLEGVNHCCLSMCGGSSDTCICCRHTLSMTRACGYGSRLSVLRRLNIFCQLGGSCGGARCCLLRTLGLSGSASLFSRVCLSLNCACLLVSGGRRTSGCLGGTARISGICARISTCQLLFRLRGLHGGP